MSKIDLISNAIQVASNELWREKLKDMPEPFYFDDETLVNACTIFMDVVLDRLWQQQEQENIPLEHRIQQAAKLGLDIRMLIRDNISVDTHELYKLVNK